jgi:Regulator of chromosome condensation (RCC1) repeat
MNIAMPEVPDEHQVRVDDCIYRGTAYRFDGAFSGTAAAKTAGSAAGAHMAPTGSPTGFIQISAGYGTGCGVRSTGAVVCWGDDFYGQADPPGQYSGPHGFPAIQFRRVSVGDEASCGLEYNHKIACWGHKKPSISFRSSASAIRRRVLRVVA